MRIYICNTKLGTMYCILPACTKELSFSITYVMKYWIYYCISRSVTRGVAAGVTRGALYPLVLPDCCSSVHSAHPLQWSNPATEQPGSAELYSPQEQHHLCSECLQTLKNTSVHASITSSVPEITWISPPRCRVQEDLTVNSTFEPLTTVSVARRCC